MLSLLENICSIIMGRIIWRPFGTIDLNWYSLMNMPLI